MESIAAYGVAAASGVAAGSGAARRSRVIFIVPSTPILRLGAGVGGGLLGAAGTRFAGAAGLVVLPLVWALFFGAVLATGRGAGAAVGPAGRFIAIRIATVASKSLPSIAPASTWNRCAPVAD